MNKSNIGNKIYNLCSILYPLHRSLMGPNNLKTLQIIKKHIPLLKISYFSSNLNCFDWKVPKQWIVKEAYIADQKGNKIIDITNHNLHVVQYSQKIDQLIDFKDLSKHLHFVKNNKDAIPYVTSYYKKNWGFCITYNQYLFLKKHKKLQIKIDSKFTNGNMHYGELKLKGKTTKEILLTTYICHPSLANNEVSGPALLTYISKYLCKLNRNYSYRILFIPETIGTICYIKKNLSSLKKNVIGGLVVTCVGIDKVISYVKSKDDNSIINRMIMRLSKKSKINYKIYNHHYKGSDERQFNSPNVGIEVGSFMSAKYDEYDEYHTSDDNLQLISPNGLSNMYSCYTDFISLMENSHIYQSTMYCEPFLAKRNLYPGISKNYKSNEYRHSTNILKVLDYCDGKNDLTEIASIVNIKLKEIENIISVLLKHKMVKKLH